MNEQPCPDCFTGRRVHSELFSWECNEPCPTCGGSQVITDERNAE